MSNVLKGLFALAIALLSLSAPAQDAGYPGEPIEQRSFDRPTWRRAIEGLDYPQRTARQNKETAPPPRQQSEDDDNRRRTRSWNFETDSPLLRALAKVVIIAGAAITLFVLLRGLLGLEWAPRNRRIRPGAVAIDIAQIEEDVEAHDLDHYIEQALADGRFDLAVRLHYLAALKALSGRRLIRWRKDKTNRDYLRELHASKLSPAFTDLTRAFERVWYGEHPLAENAYRRLEGRFRAFRSEVEV